jgi:hypothetical protein
VRQERGASVAETFQTLQLEAPLCQDDVDGIRLEPEHGALRLKLMKHMANFNDSAHGRQTLGQRAHDHVGFGHGLAIEE